MRIGDSYTYLKRTYSIEQEGIYMEASEHYVKETVKDLGMDMNTKGSKVPGTQNNLLSDAEGTKILHDERKNIYASCVMRLLYLAQDRHDVVYTVKNVEKS